MTENDDSEADSDVEVIPMKDRNNNNHAKKNTVEEESKKDQQELQTNKSSTNFMNSIFKFTGAENNKNLSMR